MSKEGRDSNRVAAILIKDDSDNILMGRRNDNLLYANAGGHLKIGECCYSGCLRELQEETGLDAKEIKLINLKKIGKNLIYLFEVIVDKEQKIDTSGDPDKEFQSLEYVDPNDIVEELHVPAKDNVVIQYWIES